MEYIIRMLCPGKSIADVVKHSELVSQYLTEVNRDPATHSDLVVDTPPSPPPMRCPICSNDNEEHMITVGCDTICLGKNNEGCGGVVSVDDLRVGYEQSSTLNQHNDLYSAQGNFESTYSRKGGWLGKCNQYVERNIQKFQQEVDGLTTSEKFKNLQRTNVYDLLEELKINSGVDHEWVDLVKHCFNEYRSRMTRIHKLPLVLASLFYLTMETTRGEREW